jgi:hypothetical protein
MAGKLWLSLQLLVLIGAANTGPILAKRAFGSWGNVPIDGGLRFIDGRPLLGASKTLRGLAAAVLLATLAAVVLGLPPTVGAVIGVAAMVGDASSSFVKRRLGVVSSDKMLGLGQIPEALLPLLAVQGTLQLSTLLIACVALAFFVLAIPLARWSHRVGLRDQPH